MSKFTLCPNVRQGCCTLGVSFESCRLVLQMYMIHVIWG